MKVLVAEDEPITRMQLTVLLQKWGYEPVCASDGEAAWGILQQEAAPALALVDWQMPGRNGDELCRLVRSQLPQKPLHIILITATRLTTEEKVNGFDAGADDYLIKPFDSAELRARLRVGERLVSLQTELRRRVKELEEALAQVKQLQGLLPICMDCNKIRDDQNYWHQVDRYIAARTHAEFTHSLCPTCFRKRMDELQLDRQVTLPFGDGASGQA
ncbi:MAG TPA: response regulator transcription factor [Candidatus Sulfotelmatobacter sp.]|nr:response regulator transcription factor [Candidatus Sulfotelmatobacter sp.]